MQYVTAERMIHRPPEIVWGVLTDVQRLTSWIEGLVDARARAEGALEVGAVIELLWRDERRRIPATSEITGVRPRELLAVETRTDHGLFFDRVRLEADRQGTKLELVAEVMSGAAYGVSFSRPRGILLGPSDDTPLHRAYDRSLDAFVRVVEATSAVPYR